MSDCAIPSIRLLFLWKPARREWVYGVLGLGSRDRSLGMVVQTSGSRSPWGDDRFPLRGSTEGQRSGPDTWPSDRC
jgi:hypothetical protein